MSKPPPGPARRRRPTPTFGEPLEPRRMLSAAVTVTVFAADPATQTGAAGTSPGIGGRVVYVDANADGIFEAGEPYAVTAAAGTAAAGTATLPLAGITTSTVPIGEVVPAGYGQTVPAQSEQVVNTANPGAVSFGNLALSTADTGSGTIASQHAFPNLGTGGHNAYVVSSVLQPDGKLDVLAQDSSATPSVVARYFPDGTPDLNFGTAGIAAADGAATVSGQQPLGIVVQPNGEIVVAGVGTVPGLSRGLYVTRLTPGGATDYSFGYTEPAAGPNVNYLYGLTQLADGSLLVSTDTFVSSSTGHSLEFYDLSGTDGSPVPAFGNAGLLAYLPPGGYLAMGDPYLHPAVAVPGGGFEFAAPTGSYTALYKFSATGTQPQVTSLAPLSTADVADDGPGYVGVDVVVELADGARVLAGFDGSQNLIVARVTAAGTPDPTFGQLFGVRSGNGLTVDSQVRHDFSGDDAIHAVRSLSVLPDGTLIATILDVRSQVNGARPNFVFADEFKPDGSLLYLSPSGIPGQTIDSSSGYLGSTDGAIAAASGTLPTFPADPADPSATAANFVFGGVGFNTAVAAPTVTTGRAAAAIVVQSAPPTAAWQTPADVTAAGTSPELLQVEYKDPVSLRRGSFTSGNLQVQTSSGTVLPATFVGFADGTAQDLYVNYAVSPVGGAWDSTDNGPYTVKLVGGQVYNTAVAAPAVTLGSFAVTVPAPVPPTASLQPPAAAASTVAAGTAATVSFAVAYTGSGRGIDPNSIRPANLTVTGPNGTPLAVVAGTATSTSNDTLTATYTVAPPADWTTGQAGAYTVALAAGQVTDAAGVGAVAATLGSFAVTVATTPVPPPTATPPTAVLSPVPAVITAGGTAVALTVTYVGTAAAINSATIGAADLTVTGPSGTSLTVTAATSGTAVGDRLPVAYTVAAPVGGWASTDNGTYTVALVAGQVADATGLPAAAATLGTFAVAVAAPAFDTAPPTAILAVVPTVNVGGTASLALSVTYVDATAVSVATLGTNDVAVTGPGGTALAVTAAAPGVSADAARVTVTYTVAAPAGGFTAAADGTYAVALVAGGVADSLGNAVAAQPLGSFAVAIGAPAAALASPVADVTTAGQPAVSFAVTYTGLSAAIDPATVGTADVTVTAANGTALAVTSAAAAAPAGNSLIVTYTAAAPAASGFASADNGTYTIAHVAGRVADATGTPAAAATLGAFAVNVPATTGGTTASTVTPSVGVKSTSATVYAGNLAVFTATVAAPAGGAVPTGTVTFYVGGDAVATVALDAAGTATYSTAALPAGSPAVTAAYSGDATYGATAAAASAAATPTVVAPAAGAAALTPSVAAVRLPASLVAGAKFKLPVPVTITNAGQATATGTVTVNVYLSADGTLDAADAMPLTTTRKLTIRAGKSTRLGLTVDALPATIAAGSYRLLVQVVDPAGFARTAASAGTVALAPPTVTPTLTFARLAGSAALSPGQRSRASAVLTLANTGNVPLSGPVLLSLFLSSDGTVAADAPVVASVQRKLAVAPGRKVSIALPVGTVPAGLAAGTYRLVARVTTTAAANGALAAVAVAVDPAVVTVG